MAENGTQVAFDIKTFSPFDGGQIVIRDNESRLHYLGKVKSLSISDGTLQVLLSWKARLTHPCRWQLSWRTWRNDRPVPHTAARWKRLHEGFLYELENARCNVSLDGMLENRILTVAVDGGAKGSIEFYPKNSPSTVDHATIRGAFPMAGGIDALRKDM